MRNNEVIWIGVLVVGVERKIRFWKYFDSRLKNLGVKENKR